MSAQRLAAAWLLAEGPHVLVIVGAEAEKTQRRLTDDHPADVDAEDDDHDVLHCDAPITSTTSCPLLVLRAAARRGSCSLVAYI